MAGHAAQNYDYLRRKNSEKQPTYSQQPRRPPTRSESQRQSNGTMNSTRTAQTAATSHDSVNTGITEPPTWSKKIVVVGDGGCGKTCLLISYANKEFPEKYVPTVFENYITQCPHTPTGKTVELALWDTAGQEEYDRLRPLSYPETDLLFVCFAIDCPNSLENVLDKWYPEVLHFCPTTPIILCGLKTDLRSKSTCIDLLRTQGLTPVSPKQGQAVADKMNAVYMECSSKDNIGVDDIFDAAVTMAVGDEYKPASSGGASAGGGSRPGGGNSPPFGGRKPKKSKCKIL
ncbi:ras-domain-containing protein [Saccharata proteae CBS 121410]|uniref:Ras-domain-containing protein n=1 Tax=Saccharata proteae CBS 121410 TaxID=1314787 RepID=A0A9P4LSV7_9PEZI|nr:ras-domain-containing protein [Saccharata proteae CBS 121410]